MVVHEGHEYLGEELLASLGIASQRLSNQIQPAQLSVNETREAFGVEIGAKDDEESKEENGSGSIASNCLDRHSE
jgi:hypothetical protein